MYTRNLMMAAALLPPVGQPAELTEESYQGWGAYQQTQLASILFSNELNRRFGEAGSTATSVAVVKLAVGAGQSAPSPSHPIHFGG